MRFISAFLLFNQTGLVKQFRANRACVPPRNGVIQTWFQAHGRSSLVWPGHVRKKDKGRYASSPCFCCGRPVQPSSVTRLLVSAFFAARKKGGKKSIHPAVFFRRAFGRRRRLQQRVDFSKVLQPGARLPSFVVRSPAVRAASPLRPAVDTLVRSNSTGTDRTTGRSLKDWSFLAVHQLSFASAGHPAKNCPFYCIFQSIDISSQFRQAILKQSPGRSLILVCLTPRGRGIV
jgi:hypothetical protein